jgi:cysteine desulfurase
VIILIYLDYSATTPVNDSVLDTYVKVTKNYIGNPNSLHKLGLESSKLINDATRQIKKILDIEEKEIIYTSGASEANNLAIFGVCRKYKNRGKHIITTRLEHSSVSECFNELEKEGFRVSYVEIDSDGRVKLDDLKSLICDDTILVSICAVNSEIGLMQDLDGIGNLLKKYPKVIFHSDITQAIGKVKLNLWNVDMASMSSQKFYGMKGVGALLKNKNLEIEPIIYGGKSTTIYRSGTPATALIVSMSKALRLAYEDFEEKYAHVLELSNYLKQKLQLIDGIILNSTSYSLPHIVNISILNVKPETILHALEEDDIYISTQTACHKAGDLSTSVLELTKNELYATHSIRISISYLTTKNEINQFIDTLKEKIDKLNSFNK